MALEAHWYRRSWLAWLLLPVALLFGVLAGLRRQLYGWGWLKSGKLPVPLIVVGNILVGGSGKTPLIVALAKRLRAEGYRVGVISRGYGGKAESWPQWVDGSSDPALVGDEPLLIAHRSGCPVVVGPDRLADGRYLLERAECDLLLADDGMQHYALQRDFEIAVVDGQRRFGNGWLLPAGPLRESPRRLNSVDWQLVNGPRTEGELGFDLVGEQLISLQDGCRRRPLRELAGQPVHAIAAIGHPQRFFDQLRAAGLAVVEHPFADHHPFSAADLRFDDNLPIVMTEKDAVKCAALATQRCWYLPVTAQLDDGFFAQLLAALKRNNNG